MSKNIPVYGTCYKCNTDNVILYEYDADYWICKANACWEEEVEHDSGRHEILQEKLDNHRRLIQATQ